MAAYIVAVLSLYWGSLYGILENLSALKVWVVDFDAQLSPYNNTTPFVGPIVQEYFRSLQAEGGSTLGWTVVSPAEFNYDPIAVRQSIYDEDAYVAIMVNANATALLQEAVNTGNQDYDPTGAIHVIYNTARDQTTVASDIVPRLLATLFPVTALIGERWVAMLAQNASNQNVWKVPQAINPAVGLTLIDLRPFNPPVVTPSVSVGLIYLTILSFFNYPFLAPIHAAFMRGKHRPLHPVQLAIWRLLSSFMTYFVLSLCYSLISLAFQVPFSNSPVPGTVSAANPNAYGRGSFVVYWMLNFVAMGSLGLPSENMAMILGQPWAAFWLIFWVITNVSTSFSPIILAPGFYKWGYAWPMHRSKTSPPFPFLPRRKSDLGCLTLMQLSKLHAPYSLVPTRELASILGFCSRGSPFQLHFTQWPSTSKGEG